MIPAEFDYAVPDSVDDALRMLADGGEDAKALAGGHSLLPLMKVRLAAPSLLVDLAKLDELRGIDAADGGFRIGALSRHADLQSRSELGVIAHAASLIADQQVRNRGTIGGSLVHGDPAADLPAVMLATEATMRVRGADGERTIPASELFQDYLTTAVGPHELLVSVEIPSLEGFAFGYEKFNRRAEDWAMVGVCALVRKAGDGSCEDARIGLTNMASTPLRATAAEQAMRGQPLDDEHIAAAAEQAAEGTEPPGDLNATSDYKRHLARVLCRRALTAAAGA